ncbi:hypothetical protein [Mesorhizobium sp. INR15]|uniref:hypothetical protein n=1 Tax=Mesorhizobium sp. INR15 TaxID=2654248 RepID=UPI00189659BA|nr:hypothetical protein [Mesorhizobium sp. INR15]QPC95716.1 hypothetical protein GA829_34600 [Mesorhizobium sp. INR15]
MRSKPTPIHKLTPAQIAFVDRLTASKNGVNMDALEYREIVAYQELQMLGMADMRIGKRRKVTIVLTDFGAQVRASGYVLRKPVVRLTEPQIAALRFLAGERRHYPDIPAHMIDVCRRMSLRGWAAWEDDVVGQFWVRITMDGLNILKLADATLN